MGMEFDFSQLKKSLSEVEKKVQNKISKESLIAGAEPILEAQKRLVPVDTGETKSALAKSKIKSKRGNKIIEVGLNSDVDKEVIARGYYHNYGFKGRGGTYWINEAFEQAKNESIDTMAKSIKEGLKKL